MITLASVSELSSSRRSSIWLIGVSFVLFQFFLQLSSGVIIGSIMNEMDLTALEAGFISSAFYYIYTSMQIPVGLLFDKKSVRLLLAVNTLVCSFGCFYFAQSHTLSHLFIGRLIIGAGSAFAFVGLSHLLRQYFPLKQFGFLIGLSETLGFLATMFGLISMGSLLNEISWRTFLNGAALLGIIISIFCWQYIPNHSPAIAPPPTQLGKQFMTILTNAKAWMNGLFTGLSFSVITVFGAMWAVPFIQTKLHCSLQQASWVDAMIFLGAALSCPLFGILATYCKRRRTLLLASCLSTALLLLTLLYLPIHRADLLGLMMFAIGVCCGAYMLAYSIANELSPPGSLSTCAGFTNTLAMLSAPLIQPLIGFLLDRFNGSKQVYSLSSFQQALTVIPIALFIAAGLVFFLPEKKS